MIDGLKLKIPFQLPPVGKDIYLYNREIEMGVPLPPLPILMAFNDVKNGYHLYIENLDVNYSRQYKGDVEYFEPSHNFESLPSSYSGVAFKIIENKEEPCIWLYASPAKIMQGFNGYGSDNLEECSLAMLNVLAINYPRLFSFLDVEKSEIQLLDVTASTRVNSESELKQVLDYIGNINSGQTKQNSKTYQFTKYWGSETSQRKQLKIYAKNQEIDAYLKHAKTKFTDERFKRIAQAHTPEVRAFCKNLLRFEARLKKKLIKEFGLPVRLKEMIALQKQNDELMIQLWLRGFDELMQALKGQTVKIHNDEQVLKSLKSKYRTITKTGKESYSKAFKLFSLYKQIKQEGYKAVKCMYPPNSTTFWRLEKDLLIGAGLSKAFLQNLHKQDNSIIIPIIKYFDIDFNAQVPDGWQAPTADNVVYFNR